MSGSSLVPQDLRLGSHSFLVIFLRLYYERAVRQDLMHTESQFISDTETRYHESEIILLVTLSKILRWALYCATVF